MALLCQALLGENSVAHVAKCTGEAHPHPKQAFSFGREEDAQTRLKIAHLDFHLLGSANPAQAVVNDNSGDTICGNRGT